MSMIGLGRSLLGLIARLSLLGLVGVVFYAPSVMAKECDRAEIPREFKRYLASVNGNEDLERYFSEKYVRMQLDRFSHFTPNEDLADLATVTNSRLRFGRLLGNILKTRVSTIRYGRELLKVVYHSNDYGAPRLVTLDYVCQGSLWRIDLITYETNESVKGWEDW